jgi:hypothetical protein
MHLVEVDVIRLQSPETVLDLAHDVDPRGAAMVEIAVRGQPDLGGQNDFVP